MSEYYFISMTIYGWLTVSILMVATLALIGDAIYCWGYKKCWREWQDSYLDLEDPEELRMDIEERELELQHDKYRLRKLNQNSK